MSNGSERMPEHSPAEELRAAARLMRERAEVVDGWYTSRAWATTAPMNLPIDKADAEHVASWHPDVALAVADLLDIVEAGCEDFDPDGPGETKMHFVCAWALNLARAYLGSAS